MLFLRERKEELKNIQQQQKFLLYKCAMRVTKTKLPEPQKQRPDTEMQIHFEGREFGRQLQVEVGGGLPS